MNARRVDSSRYEREAPHDARPAAAPDLDADLRRARQFATLMDAQFEFLGVRFGLDALVGLIPVAGDCVTALAGLYPIWVAQRHGFGRLLQTRMAVNIALDWLPGLIPVVGDIFDVGFKSNLRNVDLLERAAERRRARSTR